MNDLQSLLKKRIKLEKELTSTQKRYNKLLDTIRNKVIEEHPEWQKKK